MKKNISINISGIIFHIEEDGYDALRKYLDSINSYFGTFKDSSEILADIESRIAEIFLSKLNDGKQIITAEDVQSLIQTMGSVNDFKAAEEEPVAEPTAKEEYREEREHTQPRSGSGPKRLVRDQRHKILGGVCAGLGYYFNIDPVWPRLLMALLVLGTYGGFFIVYIVLWIALPFSDDIEDEPSVKKMYRDPDGKVIAGVAGGIAAFFGVDVVVIRVLFGITTIFFGTGLVIYIILWIALPEAKTITEKMKMQGEPVTLSNIESSVKKSLDEKEGPEESMFAKIILFPFRIIAAVLTGIAKVIGPVFSLILDIIRVAIGIMFSFTAMILIITLIVVTCVMLGIFSFHYITVGDIHLNTGNFPLEEIRRAFPTWTVIFAFVACFIPALFLMFIGNSIISKKPVIHWAVGWSLFVAFIISIAFLGIRLPQLVYSFKEEGEVKVVKNFALNGAVPLFKMRETGLDDYDFTNLDLRGHDGKDIQLVERFGAQGYSRLNAKDNAQLVEYTAEQQDSVITFDSNIKFKKDARFSFQRLDMDLVVPYNKPFAIDPEMWRLIRDRYRYDFQGSDQVQTYKLTETGKLECLSCPVAPKDLSGISQNDQFGLKDFKEIDMSGIFNVVIQQGNEYAITLSGSESRKRLYTVGVESGTLEVRYGEKNRKTFWKDTFSDDDMVTMTIVLPELERLKITGAGKVKLTGFNENETKISLLGAMVVDARISVQQLYLDIAGPIVLELDGEGDFMEATVSKAAQLKASGYTINHAIVEAKELGQARVNARQTLEIDKDFSSNVRYQGNPEIIKRD